MGLIRRHKARTPRQVQFRFWFAISIIVAMAAFVFISGLTEKGRERKEIRIAGKIDEKLDSAVQARFPGATITEAFDPVLEIMVSEDKRVRYTMEELAWEQDTDSKMWQEIFQKAEENDLLKKNGGDSLAQRKYYTRRFTIVTAEGNEITGFQKTAEDLHRTDLIYMVQKSPRQPSLENIEQTIDKLEKDIDNQ